MCKFLILWRRVKYNTQALLHFVYDTRTTHPTEKHNLHCIAFYGDLYAFSEEQSEGDRPLASTISLIVFVKYSTQAVLVFMSGCGLCFVLHQQHHPTTGQDHLCKRLIGELRVIAFLIFKILKVV